MTRRTSAAWAAGALLLASCSSDPVTSDLTPLSTLSTPAVASDAPSPSDRLSPDAVSPDTGAPATTMPNTIPTTAVVPEGFSTAIVEVTEADGTVCEVCVWLADTADERGRGLMGVTSLGAAQAMAFVWDEPTAGAFFMFQTVTPLSIAWFGAPERDGAGGALVATADMEPCLDANSATCERFAPGGDYVLAIEVFQGDLASIGISTGARARLLPDTEGVVCPLA